MKKQKEAEGLKLKAQDEKEEKKKFLSKRLNEELAKLDSLILKGKESGSSRIITGMIDDIDIDGLRTISDKIRLREKSVVVILATKSDNRPAFIISVTEDLVKKNIRAGDLAKELAKLLNGAGGGKPDFAQGGGKDAAGLGAALEKISGLIKERLI